MQLNYNYKHKMDWEGDGVPASSRLISLNHVLPTFLCQIAIKHQTLCGNFPFNPINVATAQTIKLFFLLLSFILSLESVILLRNGVTNIS